MSTALSGILVRRGGRNERLVLVQPACEGSERWVALAHDHRGRGCTVIGRPAPRLLLTEARCADHLVDGAKMFCTDPRGPRG